METTAYYALLVPVFLLFVVAEAWVARRRGHARLSFGVSYGNASAGVGAVFVGLLMGPVLYALYDWAYHTLALVHWDSQSGWFWCPWVLGLFLADMGHYWQHRMDHNLAPFWAFHGVHHQAQELNFTTAMRHTWGSDLYSFPFYAVLPVVGVPAPVFFVITTVMSFHAFITHSAELRFPSLGLFVTPQSHSLHHAQNPCYIDKNFGAMLCIWDKLFGSHVEYDPAHPPVYGIPRGYETHDGVRSQWTHMRDFLRVVQLSYRHLGRIAPAFAAAPGWVPPGAVLEPLPKARDDASIGLGTRVYVVLHFALLFVPAWGVLIWRDQQSMGIKLGMTVWVLYSLYCLGALLDGRKSAKALEAIRLTACALGLALWALTGNT